jgi:putative AlgH/UPF0301 family transcriptional regulator
MFTPSGRFETNVRICLSMSDYHPETWNPSWGVRTILIGLYSFMLDDEFSEGTIGSIKDTYENRLQYARQSIEFNNRNENFKQLLDEYDLNIVNKSNHEDTLISCRYCFESNGALIAPCKCIGSNKYVHKECLAKWQYNSILAQSTHPKYQTNIEQICNVCNSNFVFQEHSREELMLKFTGEEIANMIIKGSYLVSSENSSKSNSEIMSKHKEDGELCQNLKHWTNAVFLVTNVYGNGSDVHILGVSITNSINISSSHQLYFKWIRISRHPIINLVQKSLQLDHYIGGPCNPDVPFYLIKTDCKDLKDIDLNKHNITTVVNDEVNSILFGQLYEILNSNILVKLNKIYRLSIIWGVAGWSKTQLLGEIARGGWGLNKPVIYDKSLEMNNIWKYFLEKENVIFCGENDYCKVFKND